MGIAALREGQSGLPRPARKVSAAAWVLLATWSGAAAAEPARVHLRVTGPEECIQAPALARDVDGILGRNAIALVPAGPMPKIIVTLGPAREPGAFRSLLTLQTPDGRTVGTRELTRIGPSCGVLDGPLAVVTALLVDAAEESIHLALPPPRGVEVARAPAPPRVLPEPARWLLRSELASAVLLGLIPPAVGARLDTRVTPPGLLPLLVRFEAFPHAATTGRGPNGEFLSVAGTLGVCPERRGPRFSVGGCLGVMSGIVHAAGTNVPIQGESSSAFVTVLAEAGVGVRLTGPVSLVASTGMAWGYWPANWHVNAPGASPVVVWTPWPVALLGSLGISVDMSSENGAPSGH